ncbi:acyl-CoA dehydrogenase family protein [Rhodococcus pyridinivorans]|uniref:acyl-CoA dehydrogenase family protein n=1 Tax=Rhodococcus pyridinivorans TaxID=103816 RepID=UPI003445D5BE
MTRQANNLGVDAIMTTMLSVEQLDLLDTVRGYMNRHVEPIIAECEDAGRFPRELLPALADFGYLGGILPEEAGGHGLAFMDLAVLMEEAGYHWTSLRSTMSVINMIAVILDQGATAQQRERYLEPLLRGEKLAWFGLTEPDHGSDIRELDTTAVPDDNGDFIINGTKLWITNGAIGDFGILLANVRQPGGPEGLTAFLIDPAECSFQGRRVETMFLKATTTSELVFADTRVSRDAVVGEIGKGSKLFLAGLDIGRLNVAMGAVGASQRALEISIRYAQDRVQFGKRIGEFQLVQELIADMRVQTSATRALAYAAARSLDAGASKQVECAIAKLHATETAFEVANKALQVHGAMGLSKEYGLERIFRDARGGLIVEGTSQVQRLVIARSQLGISALV